MTPTPTTNRTREAWGGMADRFDTITTPMTMRHGTETLRRLDIVPGTRLLDVACGTGALAIPAARRGAVVTAVDLAPAMIERLLARATAAGLTAIEGRVMDCRALDLPDDSVDVAVSQNGITMTPGVAPALAEMVRVTRPGGTVLVAAFGALSGHEMLAIFVAALATVAGGPGLLAEPPLPFQLADPAVFRRELLSAGLRGVAVDTVSWDVAVDNAAALWDEVTASHPIGGQLVAGMAQSQRSDVLDVIDGVLRERSGGRPRALLHLEVNIGTGTV